MRVEIRRKTGIDRPWDVVESVPFEASRPTAERRLRAAWICARKLAEEHAATLSDAGLVALQARVVAENGAELALDRADGGRIIALEWDCDTDRLRSVVDRR
jgi:hypothetical protein